MTPHPTPYTTPGSPVVPGSSQKLFEDAEACLYTVTILKGQYEAGFFQGEDFQPGVFVDYVEAFKGAVREKRFVARNFTFDPAAVDNAKKAQERAVIDQQQTLAQLIKWCKAHYGEAMTAWMHIKVIRTFVEAVLRYGLPVDYTTVITRYACVRAHAFTHPSSFFLNLCVGARKRGLPSSPPTNHPSIPTEHPNPNTNQPGQKLRRRRRSPRRSTRSTGTSPWSRAPGRAAPTCRRTRRGRRRPTS